MLHGTFVLPDLAGTGPARLLDMIEAAPKRGWHSVPKAWCDGVEVVTMNGFTGFKTAASEEPPTATAVMEPLHAVRLARDTLDQCRRRVQQNSTGSTTTASECSSLPRTSPPMMKSP